MSGCLSGAGIVEKYYVHFIYDVDAYLTMLDKVEALTGKCLISACAPGVEDMRPLCAPRWDLRPGTAHTQPGLRACCGSATDL